MARRPRRNHEGDRPAQDQEAPPALAEAPAPEAPAEPAPPNAERAASGYVLRAKNGDTMTLNPGPLADAVKAHVGEAPYCFAFRTVAAADGEWLHVLALNCQSLAKKIGGNDVSE